MSLFIIDLTGKKKIASFEHYFNPIVVFMIKHN